MHFPVIIPTEKVDVGSQEQTAFLCQGYNLPWPFRGTFPATHCDSFLHLASRTPYSGHLPCFCRGVSIMLVITNAASCSCSNEQKWKREITSGLRSSVLIRTHTNNIPPPHSMSSPQPLHHCTGKSNANYTSTLNRGRGGLAFENNPLKNILKIIAVFILCQS
jgi:hypothetical protein